MMVLSWRDGVNELRRLVAAEGGDPDRIQDVHLAWRAFQAFLAVPLEGLFDRWEGEVEADTLVIESGVFEWPDGPPGLLLARRFAIPAVGWSDGMPDEPSDEDDPNLADTVQIEMELTFPHGTAAEADDFWTAARSGEFDAAMLAEAGELVTGLQLGRPVLSRIALTNCN
ncbi:hypothetical protein GA0074692_5191 [Micromonospora pallida]|uniref:Uncharacterized protein n=1 Tax=Micromonospora pallida TaxID=145854 RepID=A0A1C6TAZ9_9ACTN|nr:hypothetical protein [Micromonospora pallida]SCL38951.1 hypothetical protein GA0074692_5191 [Micromonospora pallida]